jgi:hypothetical protein
VHFQVTLAALPRLEPSVLLFAAVVGGILGIWALKGLFSLLRAVLGFVIGALIVGGLAWLIFSGQNTPWYKRFLKPEVQAAFREAKARHVDFLGNLSERPSSKLN